MIWAFPEAHAIAVGLSGDARDRQAPPASTKPEGTAQDTPTPARDALHRALAEMRF
ncbi:hypothetical protein [Pseudooceanicola onchidii]|uniref:hypothetical protein n=1 Tax=Pseudooceanicola onchidii TaxID=2562279 RepID=UPI00145BCADB|nr:hypothetical protein [Pseudooceanicola onchidii]